MQKNDCVEALAGENLLFSARHPERWKLQSSPIIECLMEQQTQAIADTAAILNLKCEEVLGEGFQRPC